MCDMAICDVDAMKVSKMGRLRRSQPSSHPSRITFTSLSLSINQRLVRARACSRRKKQFLINNNRFHDGETVISHYLGSCVPRSSAHRTRILFDSPLQGIIAYFSQLMSPISSSDSIAHYG